MAVISMTEYGSQVIIKANGKQIFAYRNFTNGVNYNMQCGFNLLIFKGEKITFEKTAAAAIEGATFQKFLAV